MYSYFTKLNIAILGGDERELVLAEELKRLGSSVRVVGQSEQQCQQLGLNVVDSVQKALEGAHIAIAPMPGTDFDGQIKAPFSSKPIYLDNNALKGMSKGGLLLIGIAKPIVKQLCENNNIKIIELAELDEIAIPNAIPTAEGALQLTMEKLPVTIHGCKAAILGFGRVGFTMNRVLKALNAETLVVARKLSALARAEEMGAETFTIEHLREALQNVDVVYNTIPNLILTRDVLSVLPNSILLIDLASAPGGIDFDATKEFGIHAIFAPGLPGKVAPKTAGQILAKFVPQIILREYQIV